MIPYKELILTKEYWKEVIENRMFERKIISIGSDVKFIKLLTYDILKALNKIKK